MINFRKGIAFLKYSYEKNKPFLFSYSFLTIFYGLSRVVAYAAPLLLFNVINSPENFGEFDYILNLGQTISPILGFSFPVAYTYYLLKEHEDKFKSFIHLFYLCTSAFLLCLIVISTKLLSNIYMCAVTIGFITSNQLYYSTLFRLRSKNYLSIVVENGLYILLIFYSILIYEGYISFKIEYWTIILISYNTIITLLLHVRGINFFSKIHFRGLSRLLKYGGLVTACFILISLVTVNTRVYAKFFVNFGDVGIYSYYLRTAAVVIVFHRVFQLIFFKQLYTAPHYKLDKAFTFILVLVNAVNIMVYYVLPKIRTLGINLESSNNKLIWVSVICQTIIWVPINLMDTIIQRENFVRGYLLNLLGIVGTMLTVLIICYYWTTLGIVDVVLINVCFMIITAVSQLNLLRNKHINYPKTAYMLFISMIFWVIIICVTFLQKPN